MIKREVKSFAKRQRRLTPRQAAAFSHCWEEKGIALVEGQLIDLDKVFGRRAERVLEIGFGNGDSLWQMAKENRHQDYLGVEVHRPGIASLLAHMVENEVDNIRVIESDVVVMLRDNIPDASLSRVQIFFPDPWPKKRHHKRRLIQPEFIQLLRKKLKPGGIIHCATDWENYAEHMMAVLTSSEGFANIVGDNEYADNSSQQLRPNTKFEKRGVNLGHGVWDLLFCKQ